MQNLRTLFIALAVSSASFAHTSDTKKPDIKIAQSSLPAIATLFKNVEFVKPEVLAIILSDGSRWIINSASTAEDCQVISEKWKIDDDIRLKPYSIEGLKTNEFVLKNARTQDVFLVNLDPFCTDTSLAFFIEKIDKNGYVLITQNGLEWAFSWIASFSSYKWRPGDRIIINKSELLLNETYEIINAFDASSCHATLISWK